MPEQVQRYGRWLTTQRKDERQHNSDRRQLALQHPSDLLCSLTRERDRRRTARHRLDRTSSFAISNFPRARHEVHAVMLSFILSLSSQPSSISLDQLTRGVARSQTLPSHSIGTLRTSVQSIDATRGSGGMLPQEFQTSQVGPEALPLVLRHYNQGVFDFNT